MICSVAIFLLTLHGLGEASSNLDPQFGWCSNNLTIANPKCTLDNVAGDWLLVYSTDISLRKGSSVWGPGLPYDYCDPMNLNKGCMGVGVSYTTTKDNKQLGYTYAFNSFTETWTITQFQNNIYQSSETSSVGFRVNYLHYVEVPDKELFVNNKPAACGSAKVVRSGPIYRSSNYVILTAASDYSWVVLLYCDAFYGFLIDTPLIQILVKKSYINQVSYPISTCPFYQDVKDAISKTPFDLYAGDFSLVYHDEGGNYPTSVSWESFDWEADCLCAKPI